MRAAILLGLMLIASAIHNHTKITFELTENALSYDNLTFLAKVIIVLFVMDVIELIKRK